MLEFPPRSILDQAREGRRAAEAAADDTDTDDEALGEALGEMAEEQSGAAGVLANPNALGKRAKRTYRDDTKRWVDVPDEIPERLKNLLAFCDEKTNPLWASVGLNNIPSLPQEGEDRFALTDKIVASAARFRSNATKKRLTKASGAPDKDVARERVRVLTDDSVVAVWTDPRGRTRVVIGDQGSDELARDGWTCTVTANQVHIPGRSQQHATREAIDGDADDPDGVGIILPKYAEVSADGVLLAKHEALIRAVEIGFEVEGARFAPLRKWTNHRRKQAWREEALGRQGVKKLQTQFSDLLGVYWALTHPEQLTGDLTVLSGFKPLKSEGGRMLKCMHGERFDLVAQLAGERARRAGDAGEGVAGGGGGGRG